MSARQAWRTPAVVLLCGGVILTLSLGVRHTFGLFLQPMTADHGWG
ncbi:MAG TPA: MFS transporter, partial [Burkholderiales bacterium]